MLDLPVTCVIPARLASTRLPIKLLRPVLGVPLVIHTLDRALEAACFAHVICLTDDSRLAEIVRAAGHEAMVGGHANNGTERIARHLEDLPGDLFLNLQGDEPAFPAAGLRRLARALAQDPDGAHLLVHRIPAQEEELKDPNRVKAEIDGRGRVVDLWRHYPLAKGLSTHVQAGTYGYSRKWLRNYAAIPPSSDELALSHEMLRFPSLDGLRAHTFFGHSQAVDVEADLAVAESLVAAIPQARRISALAT